MGAAPGHSLLFTEFSPSCHYQKCVYTYPIAHTTANTLPNKASPYMWAHTVGCCLQLRPLETRPAAHGHARPSQCTSNSSSTSINYVHPKLHTVCNTAVHEYFTLSKPAQGIHRRDSRQGVISNGVRAHETFLHPPPITHVPQRRECPCLHTIAQFTIMAVSSQARNQSAAVVDRNKEGEDRRPDDGREPTGHAESVDLSARPDPLRMKGRSAAFMLESQRARHRLPSRRAVTFDAAAAVPI